MANRLINEESPYLQQHANNPVDWYPWGAEAFNRAIKENKPIFLSIGYSSCHWCHVMERESFENEEIAKKLNENFISIKVDKEERPDIDKHFQEIFIKMNNRAGGWPLSIFMTPQKIPFYSATYIPPTPRYGIIGFSELLDIITQKYQTDYEKLVSEGQEVLNALKPKTKIEATKITPALIDIATKQIKYVYEPKFGGFGNAPKFPHSSTINLAINLYRLTKDDELKDIVINTLDNMLLGGIYDLVDGGFCRYSTDEKWLVPHFEKMIYDNALMSKTLIEAFKTFGISYYKEKAIEIIDFMIDKMSQNNLFFSASDADSNGVEGEYFVYDYDEVANEFIKHNISLDWLDKLSITKLGNFGGKNIVRLADKKIREDKNLKEVLNILKDIRKKRDYPFIDKKVITSWNAMMIDSIFKISQIDDKYLNIAIKFLKSLEDKMIDGLDVYHSALIGNRPKIMGFLEDYSYLTNCYISAFNATLDESYLIKATNIANEAVKRFYKDGKWLIGDGEFKNFEDDYDTSYISSTALMVQNMLTLRSLVEPIYKKFAFKTLEVNSYNLMRQPISRPTLTDSAIRYLKDDIIIKSNIFNLEKIKFKNFTYPYVAFKVTLDENIEVCTNKACFATAKSVDELDSIVK